MEPPDKLPSDQFQRLVQILSNFGRLETHERKSAFLLNSGLSTLEHDLQLNAATRDFAAELVRETLRVGKIIEADEYAFWLLLRHLGMLVSGREQELQFVKTLFRQEVASPATVVSFALPAETLPEPADFTVPYRVPFNRNPDFVGREKELGDITRALNSSKRVVISGIGGVGKTQLAIEWAYRYGNLFPGGVFWLNFQEPSAIPEEITAAGAAYIFPAYTNLNIPEQANRVREEWNKTGAPTLLIFDNCEDVTLFRDFLPKSSACYVLSTSRNPHFSIALRSAGVETLPIETLSPEDSIALLRRFRPDMSEVHSIAIAAELGYLPLALHIAGSFLLKYQSTNYGDPQTYLGRLRSRDLLEELEKQAQRLQSEPPTGHDPNVARTFLLSVEQLSDPHLTDPDLPVILLRLLAQFAPGTIVPVEWLNSALPTNVDELEAADTVIRLVEVGLVEVPRARHLRLHLLIAKVVERTLSAEQRAEFSWQSEQIIRATQPQKGVDNFAREMDVWLPHARHIAQRAISRQDASCALLVFAVGEGLRYLALYNEALPFLQQVLKIWKAIAGDNHPATAKTLHSLAEVYRAQGKYQIALPLYEEALTVQRKLPVGNYE